MTPRKKGRTQNPDTVTPLLEDDSTPCSELEESCCEDSCVSEDNENSSC